MTTTQTDQSTAALIAELRAEFAGGSTRPYEWRIAQLEGIERLCAEREPEIAAALASDLGRSATEAFLGDIVSTRGEAAFARRHLRSWMRKKRVPVPLAQLPSRAWIQYEPLGVVLIIGPWNYPFGLAVGPLIDAVAAGNCAVVKPSELAPATSALIARLLPQYVDPQAVRVIEGDAAVTQELLAQGFDHALFTGGTEVGKKIMAAAAPTLTPVTLELGGKSPVIVTRNANIDVTARRIVWTKLLNSGQTCIAPDYVLADSAVVDDLTARIVEYLKKFRSAEIETSVPIVNERQYRRLVGLIDATEGEIAAGGGRDEQRLRIEPTVITGAAPSEPAMSDEIFGPILPIMTYDGIDQAVDFVNSRPKPLGLYIFSDDGTESRGLIDRITSGGAVINHLTMHYLVPQLPFGGVGASGMGAYHGFHGFKTFSHERAVLSRWSKPDPALFYPPYSELALKLIRKVF